jgi:hypothetical protein
MGVAIFHKEILIAHSQLSPSTYQNLYTPSSYFSSFIKDEITLPIKRDLLLNKFPSTEFSGSTKTMTTISLFILNQEVEVK